MIKVRRRTEEVRVCDICGEEARWMQSCGVCGLRDICDKCKVTVDFEISEEDGDIVQQVRLFGCKKCIKTTVDLEEAIKKLVLK